MTGNPLLRQAEAAGMTLWLDGGRLRWRASRPPSPDLLAALRERRGEVMEALQPPEGTAFLLAFTAASYAALVQREPDANEEAERAAIFGRPPPPLAVPLTEREATPEAKHRTGSHWNPASTPGRTLALLRTPGVEVLVERDGWLRISTPEGTCAFAKRELAERLGWQG